MKVALLGATGNVGTRIQAELLRRGHLVTAISRRPATSQPADGVTAVTGDAADPDDLAAKLQGHDAVISSVRFVDSDPDKLITAVRKAGVRRYLIVGGAGSLEIAPGQRLVDSPDFPAAHKDEALAGGVFLDRLRQVDDLDWTFLSPSAMFAPGDRTGQFRLGRDQLLVNDQGSSISFEDYAIALIDELERPAHIRQRYTVGY